jgi:enamine deaminase RidA (YjgF/YER057c/UK114 family)
MAADRLISSGGPWEEIIGYSRAVVAGEYVHVSGSTATVNGELLHEGDTYLQLQTAFQVISDALKQVDYSLSDVVRCRVYLSDEADMDEAGRAHGELFSAIRPALTMLSGIKFINPKMLVEVEVDAWKRK